MHFIGIFRQKLHKYTIFVQLAIKKHSTEIVSSFYKTCSQNRLSPTPNFSSFSLQRRHSFKRPHSAKRKIPAEMIMNSTFKLQKVKSNQMPLERILAENCSFQIMDFLLHVIGGSANKSATCRWRAHLNKISIFIKS